VADDALPRSRWLGPLVLMTLLVIGLADGSTRSASGPILDGPYGPAIGADALANTQIGGDSSRSPNLLTAYRFRATESAALSTIRVYLVDGDGYAGGTGGTVAIRLRGDSGAPDHVPTGADLSTATITPGNPITGGFLPLIRFAAPATLVAGELYHLEFENTDPSPRTNFVSINGLWTSVVTRPRQPTLEDLDWAQLIDEGNGWTVRPSSTPILDLGYENGIHAGIGYMEVWVNAARQISGTNAVREVFIPTIARRVSTVSVRVRRLAGASPLTLRVGESADGPVLAEATIPGSSLGEVPVWVTADLPSSIVLQAGVPYELLLAAPADSSYSAVAIERGDHYDFAASTYFADGYGQYTTGSGWSGFDQPGGTTNNKNSDLQFYFR